MIQGFRGERFNSLNDCLSWLRKQSLACHQRKTYLSNWQIIPHEKMFYAVCSFDIDAPAYKEEEIVQTAPNA